MATASQSSAPLVALLPVRAPSPDVVRLEQDNRSLKLRSRALFKALVERAEPSTVVAVFGSTRSVEQLLEEARRCESLGFVPAIRFVRDADLVITGVSLALLELAPDPDDETDAAIALRLQGMSVTAGGFE